jgi:hypothetical protein
VTTHEGETLTKRDVTARRGPQRCTRHSPGNSRGISPLLYLRRERFAACGHLLKCAGGAATFLTRVGGSIG